MPLILELIIRVQAVQASACLCYWCTDDVESHQLVLDSMPLLLEMFTSRKTQTQTTLQLLRTFSLVCHRNRVAQVVKCRLCCLLARDC